MEELTDRDLELIEVALESAISAVSFSFSPSDKREMDGLGAEYKHALAGVQKLRAKRTGGQ
jgi:hypothetical protein